MTEKQLLALVVAILLQGQNVTSESQVQQALDFAKLILKETQ